MYTAAEQAARQAWANAESLAWSAYEAAREAAEAAWAAVEAAASAAFDQSIAAAMQAWNAAESAAWAQYEADCLAAEQAWAAAADAAMAEYYADAAAAATAWNTDEAAYRATLAADVADAESAWYADEAAAFAVFEGLVGSEAAQHRRTLTQPYTVAQVVETLAAAPAPEAAKPGGGLDTLRGALIDISNGANLAEARRIAAAIQNTWSKNWRLYPPITFHGVPETRRGYWCYEWAYAFEKAALAEEPRHFDVRIWSAGADDERLHAWIEIISRDTKRSIFVDDGFWERGRHVHSEAPYGGDYRHLRPGCDVPRDQCRPPQAYDSAGRKVTPTR